MVARPRRKRTEALLFACRNANGVRGRKLELDHFLGQSGIDIFLLSDNHLRSGEAFRMANYICHRSDRLTVGGGKAILAIDHYALPVQGLMHPEDTAIYVLMGSKPVKIVADYLSPIRPLFASYLSACLGGGLPILTVGDLNAKHVDLNSRLTSA